MKVCSLIKVFTVRLKRKGRMERKGKRKDH